MSNFSDLVELRNKLTNDTDYVIFEEDCQLLDRVLDDYEQRDQRIAELEKENNALFEFTKMGTSLDKFIKDLIKDEEISNQKALEQVNIDNEILREEKQTAVKEFADELCYRLNYMENTLIGGKVYTQNKDFIERLNLLLKERGIE